MDELYEQLMACGLVQFGQFGPDARPLAIHAHLLPSYPDVLQAMVHRADPTRFHLTVDRLVCSVDALPFGVAFSLTSAIPLIYNLGTDQPGVYDFIGAYDVGHPALLIANTWSADALSIQLINKAKRVGLEISGILSLFDIGQPVDGMAVYSVVDIQTMVDSLVAESRLPPGQADAVKAWLKQENTRSA
ncbi:MAG: hypothetical protein ACOCX5_03670 [Chloroflexota bacterium]